MSKDCLFLAESREMEGMMKFCLNENAYEQKDYKNISPKCENCKFYVSKTELKKEIIEEQKIEKWESDDDVDWEMMQNGEITD